MLSISISSFFLNSFISFQTWILSFQLNYNIQKDFSNSLQNDKTLAISKLKALADHNFKVAKMVQIFSDRVENIVVSSIFSFSHNVF